ncbi:hypothetical protein LL254_07020 [Marinobacter nauticus]|uniref:hypothetical protein n=1 Tax=Marinobacter nauticus TaxID=2743 RepID=UPI001D1914CC|nr:hypothetical protein [Marinobacter nauticus]MCC4270458.1 hypothetical protein [Marinobacter nauticus]
MIEEAVIHVGMHKTGSSSIQSTLHNLGQDLGSGFGYLKLNSPNHSGFFMTILSKKPEEYHAHKLNCRSKEEVINIQARYEAQLDEALSSFKMGKVIISAEDLSAPSVTTEMLEYLRERISQYCRKIRIIGYVRPPLGYMQSAFQQRLKGAVVKKLELRYLWPHYRARFESLDQVFGPDSVELVAFKPKDLFRGDVVYDFARRVGITLNESDVVRTNESLSLEASSVLFALRYFEDEVRYPGFTEDNNKLIDAISNIGEKKLRFSPESTRSILSDRNDDLEWMNKRLGESVEDESTSDGFTIGSENELLNIAVTSVNALWRILDSKDMQTDTNGRVFELIDRLRLIVSRGNLLHKSRSRFFRTGGKSPAEILADAAREFSKLEPNASAVFRRTSVQAEKILANGSEIKGHALPVLNQKEGFQE